MTALSACRTARCYGVRDLARGAIASTVEFPNARRRTREIAREYFSAADKRLAETAAGGLLLMLWVLKEAHLKALRFASARARHARVPRCAGPS